MNRIDAERAPAPARARASSAPPSAVGRAPVRRSLLVGAADDVAERDADRVARAVVDGLRAISSGGPGGAGPFGDGSSAGGTGGTSRIARAAARPGVRAAPSISRIQPRDPGVVRRKIGAGQSHKEVARTKDDARFITGIEKGGQYPLQPIAGGPATTTVHVDDDAFRLVGDVDADALVGVVKPIDNPDAAYDIVEWTSQVRNAVATDDLASAKALLERMRGLLGGLPASVSPALSDAELESRLKGLRYGAYLFRDFRANLLVPHGDAVALLKDVVTTKKILLTKQGKHDFTTEDEAALALDLANRLRTERRKADMLPTLIRLIDADKRVVERAIARKERAQHEAELPKVMEDVDVKAVYKTSAVVKLAQHKARKHVYVEAIALAESEGVGAPEAATRAALIDHLLGPMEDPASAWIKIPDVVVPKGLSATEEEAARKAAQEKHDKAVSDEAARVVAETRRIADKIKEASVETIITRDLAKKSSRIKYLFAGSEGEDLLKDVAKLVPADVHKTLAAMRGGEQHSIFEINDYVGDKLNEPLMQWILKKGIQVEVHASGVLASFAKMKSEGFTDVIEIPSSHAGTRKYIVARPEDGKAKVVFQTMPGASYAIQTVGAFLFYEIYEHGGLVDKIVVADTTPWKYKEFKARNVISRTGNVARYLLQDRGVTLTADVPFTKAPHKIDDDGAIVLDGVPASAIVVNQVAVKRLDEKNLQIFTEGIDHKTVYLDIMRSNGITRVDIAAMGRKGQLKKLLLERGLKPDIEITLPNFNTSVYYLKSKADTKVLAAFQLSPDFFGDRSGALTEALQELGTEHITFVGTSGGLGAGVELNDLFVPAELANVAETMPGDDVDVSSDRVPNTAFTELAGLKAEASVDAPTLKSGGLHVGVHSPITESMKMITWMKKQNVQSVDCEAGFIANALKSSKISLYALYFIGDLPGTHHSIGMGGTSASDDTEEDTATTGAKKELATSEKLVQAIIKRIVGGEIERADVAEPDLPPVNKLGQISILYGAKGERKVLQITVVEPSVATTGSSIGVLRTFGRSLKDVPREKPKEKDKGALVVSLDTMNDLNRRAAEFSAQHKVKLLLDVV